MKSKTTQLRLSSKIFYGVGNTSYSVISQTTNNFIMYFGSAALSLPASLVSLSIAISTVWDALSDPILGSISDKTHSKKFGKRHGYILFGCFGMIVFNLFLWLTPISLPTSLKFVWLCLGLIALETCNTIFITPYTALGIELSDDYNERTSVQSVKTVFFLIGMILPTLIAGFVMSKTSGGYENPQSYFYIAVCTSAVCLICGLLCFLGTKKYIKNGTSVLKPRKQGIISVFLQFFKTLGKPQFRNLIFGYASSLLSAAFLTGVGLHVFTYTFHFGVLQKTLLMSSLIISAILSQPVWFFVSKIKKKRKTLIFALLVALSGVIIIVVLFLLKTYIKTTILFCLLLFALFVCGFGSGALYSIPISLYADIIGIEKEKTGEEKSATYNAYLTFAYKIASALALVVIGLVLDAIGFASKDELGNDILVQPIFIQNALFWLLITGVFASIVLSLCFYTKLKADILYDENIEK